jgi:hypothetical protein
LAQYDSFAKLGSSGNMAESFSKKPGLIRRAPTVTVLSVSLVSKNFTNPGSVLFAFSIATATILFMKSPRCWLKAVAKDILAQVFMSPAQ